MDLTRRSFIRWVLGAGAAAACPFPLHAAGREGGGAPEPRLKGENPSVCHAVRDGERLPMPAPDERRDIVIVGGGPSGLAAADEVKSTDFVLLEKEPRLGGNCLSEEWEGCRFSTAAAWDSVPTPEFQELARRWGFDWTRIQGEDSVCFEGTWIRDFWNGRADNPSFDKLPYDASVKAGFRAFLRDIEDLDLEAQRDRLDALTFASLLEGYPPQLKRFWDRFGPSNWGAATESTSGYLGLQAARDWFRSPRYTWEGGIGVASEKVVASIGARGAGRLRAGATVYSVTREGRGAVVRFFEDGKPRAIEARAVVMATPKFITRRLVAGLPAAQAEAMGAMRYEPFPVFNLCFDRMVWDGGYDNYPLDAKSFTDFVPADWITHGEGGDPSRRQVLTVYAPLPEDERARLLDDEGALSLARDAVTELTGMFPSWLDHLREVRVHRRGHPMPMSAPGHLTRLQPAARADFDPVYFAHSDALGEVSDFFYASLSGLAAARKALARL